MAWGRNVLGSLGALLFLTRCALPELSVGRDRSPGTGGDSNNLGGANSGGGPGSGASSTGGAPSAGGSISSGGSVATGGGATGGAGTGGIGGFGGSDCITYDGVGTLNRGAADGPFEFDTGGVGYSFSVMNPSAGGTAIECGEPSASATGLCFAGSLPKDAAFGSVAVLGLNVNQAEAGANAAPLARTVSNIFVSYSMQTVSPLRIVISTSSNVDYCFEPSVGQSSVTIQPSSFNSACWNGSGTAWNGTGLTSVRLVVPGSNATSTLFDVCLTGVTLG